MRGNRLLVCTCLPAPTDLNNPPRTYQHLAFASMMLFLARLFVQSLCCTQTCINLFINCWKKADTHIYKNAPVWWSTLLRILACCQLFALVEKPHQKIQKILSVASYLILNSFCCILNCWGLFISSCEVAGWTLSMSLHLSQSGSSGQRDHHPLLCAVLSSAQFCTSVRKW